MKFAQWIIGSMVFALVTPFVLADANQKVGEWSTDYTGNSIVVERFEDPNVRGVSCFLSHFSRSLVDRAMQGSWFTDPSDSSIDCRQTGEISVGRIDLSEKGEEVFSERTSLIFRSLNVRRILDRQSNSLIYVAYASRILKGSAKTSLSIVPLGNAQVR